MSTEDLRAALDNVIAGCNLLIESDRALAGTIDNVVHNMTQEIHEQRVRIDIANKRIRKLEEALAKVQRRIYD